MPYTSAVLSVLVAALMTSCAPTATTPIATTAAEQCEQNRGAWRALVNYCEYGTAR